MNVVVSQGVHAVFGPLLSLTFPKVEEEVTPIIFFSTTSWSAALTTKRVFIRLGREGEEEEGEGILSWEHGGLLFPEEEYSLVIQYEGQSLLLLVQDGEASLLGFPHLLVVTEGEGEE
jgi:hypothetical protein